VDADQRDAGADVKTTEAAMIEATNAVSLAREVINKYGADADKPSVKLAIALVNGAHERDTLRTELTVTTAERDYLRTHPFETLRAMGFEVDETGVKRQQIMERELVRVTAERDEARAQRDELEAIKHAEERPIRTELRLTKAELEAGYAKLTELVKEHEALVEATILGPLKGKTAHDEIVSLRAEVKRLEQYGLDEYARGVVDGSEINVNILAESKADLEEQRQEIGRLRADIEWMRPVYEAAAACPLTSSDGWLMCQLKARHGGACDMKDISLAKEKP
jgi:hypothetical protein